MTETDLRLVLEGLPHVDLEKVRVVRSSGSDWLMMPCPLAPHTHERGTDRNLSFGISLETPSRFHCFACHSRGSVPQLLAMIADYSGVDLTDRINRIDDRPSVDSILAVKPARQQLVLDPSALPWHSVVDYDDPMHYLVGRGVDRDQAGDWDIRWDGVNRRVVLPIYTDGLNGAVGRSIDRKSYHYYFGMETSLCLFGLHRLPPVRKILVVEGPFCTVRAFPIARKNGVGVVATLTSHCSPRQAELLINTDARIICAYDQDLAGNRGYGGHRGEGGMVRQGFPRLQRACWNWRSGDKVVDVGGMSDEQLEVLTRL